MHFIYQDSKNSCGFTCLKILLANVNKDKNYLFIKEEREDDLSYFDLINIGKKYDLNLSGYIFDDKNKIKNIKKNFICTIEKEDKKHAVIAKIKGERVEIIDPMYGKVYVSFKEFKNIWNKNALMIENYKKHKLENKTKIKIIPRRYTLVLIIFKLLSLSLLVSGLGLIDKNVHFSLPLIVLSFFMICEITYKYLSVYILYKIDNNFIIKKTYKDFDFKSKKHYEIYETYKSKTLFLPLNYLFSFISILLLMFLIVFNNVNNLIFLFGTIIIFIIDIIFIYPKEKNKKYKIDTLEYELINKKDDKLDIFKKLHQCTYKFVNFISLKRTIYLIIIFILIVVSMFINKIISLSFILFYFVLTFYLFEQIEKFTHVKDDIDKYNLIKIKFIKTFVD